jgi:hypothetical protein
MGLVTQKKGRTGKPGAAWKPSKQLLSVLPNADQVFVDDGSNEADSTARDARGLSAAVAKSKGHVYAANSTNNYLVVVFTSDAQVDRFRDRFGIEPSVQTVDGDALLRMS